MVSVESVTSAAVPVILEEWELFLIGVGVILFLFLVFIGVNRFSSPHRQLEEFDE